MKTLITRVCLSGFLFWASCVRLDPGEADVAPRNNDLFDFYPSHCAADSVASGLLHRKHLDFARLLAVACNQSAALREAVRAASHSEEEARFHEILVSDFLDDAAGASTVYQVLEGVYNQMSEPIPEAPFASFTADLLAADPLIVLKIPDWFSGSPWAIAQTPPLVISNTRAQDLRYYGYDPQGRCFSKSRLKSAFMLEMMVKTSEDYLWTASDDFVQGFLNPCMPYTVFNQQFARPYYGGVLYKRSDFRKLFSGCNTDPDEPQASPPPGVCLRDEGFDWNYMRGFRLANTGVLATLDNQPCLDGEETFDFQIDFLYANRTSELEAQGLQLLPLPVYGLRASDLVDQQLVAAGTITTVFGNTVTLYEVQEVPGYFSFGIGPMKFNYTKLINPALVEWDRAKYGDRIYVTWHETDFEICTSQGVTTVQSTVSYQQQVQFNVQFAPGTTLGGNQQFTGSLQKTLQYTLAIKGDAVIPLGYNGLGYCDEPNPFSYMALYYPTGPSGLLVDFSYYLQ